jgi:hypothetical protein
MPWPRRWARVTTSWTFGRGLAAKVETGEAVDQADSVAAIINQPAVESRQGPEFGDKIGLRVSRKPSAIAHLRTQLRLVLMKHAANFGREMIAFLEPDSIVFGESVGLF